MADMVDRLAKLIIVSLLIALLNSNAVLAISDAQKQVLNNNSLFFNVDTGGGGTGSGCSDSSLVGGDNYEKAYNFMVGKGLPGQAAAGVLGNWTYESHVDPTAQQKAGAWQNMDPKVYESAVGIVQWDGPRRVAIINAAKAAGFSLSDLENGAPGLLAFELNYFLNELTTTYPGTYAELQKETNAGQAAKDFLIGYENSLAATNPVFYKEAQRMAAAEQLYAKYGSGGGGGAGSDCIIGRGTDCTNVSGDAKILCEAEKYQGIYYDMGGGHQGYTAFIAGCPDPSNPPNNVPYGGPNGGSPSPCATDCSGLVNVAVDEAFNLDYGWYVSNSTGEMIGAGNQYWKPIPISQAQAGDIVTTNAGGGTPGDGHVEIVVKVQGNSVSTFGSHSPGKQTGQVNSSASYWTSGAWHWTGPGSSGS